MGNWLKEHQLFAAIVIGAFIIGGFIYISGAEEPAVSESKESPTNFLSPPATNKAGEEISQKEAAQPSPPLLSGSGDAGSNITAQEISPYKRTVVHVSCYEIGPSGGEVLTGWGSGFIITSNVGDLLIPSVLTNKHVITTNHCKAFNETIGMWGLDTAQTFSWNSSTDHISVKIGKEETSFAYSVANELPTTDELPACSSKIPTGSPVAIIGYPASTGLDDFGTPTYNQTVTTGIISSHDRSLLYKGWPDVNYFTDAQVDSGNSGGLALTKTNGGLCALGLPTQVSLGNFQTQGLILSINNITAR